MTRNKFSNSAKRRVYSSKLCLIVAVPCFWLGSLKAGVDYQSVHCEVTPYLWSAAVSGTTAVDREDSPPIDSDYGFFLG